MRVRKPWLGVLLLSLLLEIFSGSEARNPSIFSSPLCFGIVRNRDDTYLAVVINPINNTIIQEIGLSAKFDPASVIGTTFNSSVNETKFIIRTRNEIQQINYNLTSSSFQLSTLKRLRGDLGSILPYFPYNGSHFFSVRGGKCAEIGILNWETGESTNNSPKSPALPPIGAGTSQDGNSLALFSGLAGSPFQILLFDTAMNRVILNRPLTHQCPNLLKFPEFFGFVSPMGMLGDNLFGVFPPNRLFAIDIGSEMPKCEELYNLTCGTEGARSTATHVAFAREQGIFYVFVHEATQSCILAFDSSVRPLKPVISPLGPPRDFVSSPVVIA